MSDPIAALSEGVERSFLYQNHSKFRALQRHGLQFQRFTKYSQDNRGFCCPPHIGWIKPRPSCLSAFPFTVVQASWVTSVSDRTGFDWKGKQRSYFPRLGRRRAIGLPSGILLLPTNIYPHCSYGPYWTLVCYFCQLVSSLSSTVVHRWYMTIGKAHLWNRERFINSDS